MAPDPAFGHRRIHRLGRAPLQRTQSGLGLGQPGLILYQSQLGHRFQEMFASDVPFAAPGLDVAQGEQAVSNARAVTDLLADAQRLVHLIERLVQRTDLPLQTGQSMVDPRGHQPVAGSLAVG